jgi:exopolysaccharide biosynthesis protein
MWDGYGFGINAGTLRYNSGGNHTFYTGSTNTATLDSSGNLSIGGKLTGGTNVFKKVSFAFNPVYSSIPVGYYYI